MAEPISVAAGIISLVERSKRLFSTTSNLSGLDKRDPAYVLEAEICSRILDEIGQVSLSAPSSLPESATLSLQLCQLHLQTLIQAFAHAMSKPSIAQHNARQMQENALKKFRRSVKLLRDIVME